MASAAKMLLAGLCLLIDTVVIMIMIIVGDQVFKPITQWALSFQYGKTPPIDPGMINWAFPVFFGVCIAIWFALLYSVYAMAISDIAYPYGG